MDEVIGQLYRVFAKYKVNQYFTSGTEYAIEKHATDRLLSISPRQLSFEDLQSYWQHAITTWGTVDHFKHFLPRMLELLVSADLDQLGADKLAVLMSKLNDADWQSWPEGETVVIQQFLELLWRHHLAIPAEAAWQCPIDLVLYSLSLACQSIQSFLDIWLFTDTSIAQQHLAGLMIKHEVALINNQPLTGDFWNEQEEAASQLLAWLKSKPVREYLLKEHANQSQEELDHARLILDVI